MNLTALTPILFSLSRAVSPGAPGEEAAVSAAVRGAIDRVGPALVRIHVVSAEYEQGREIKQEGSGSGTIISARGHVITNHHVAGRARRIVCTLSTKEELEADLVGTDPLSDIAILLLKHDGTRTFPTVSFGDSTAVRTGDRVLAMGSPLALSQSVTLGIVSNTEMITPRMFWPFRLMLEGEDVGLIVRWIGHDAAIYPGNSGGPLVNLRGEMVGVNEISLGLSGAIPADLAREVAQSIIQHGKVQRSWTGLEVQPLLKGAPSRKGVLVSGALADSPAEKAGVKAGDILLRVGAKEVNGRFDAELPSVNRVLMGLPLGKPVELLLNRDGKPLTITVVPVEREAARARDEEFKAWGMTARNLTLWTAMELSRDSRDGVLVRSVRPGGPCQQARPPIRERDIVVSVNNTAVKSVEQLQQVTEAWVANKEEPVAVLVGFQRHGQHVLTVVRVGMEKAEEPVLEARKPWLPASMQVVTPELAQAMGTGVPGGVRLTQVYAGGSADKAGLKAGDIITALDGEPLTVMQPEDVDVLPATLRQYRMGSVVELTVFRQGKTMRMKVPLDTTPRTEGEMKRYHDDNFAFSVRDKAFQDQVGERWREGQGGVLVDEVGQGGWAALGQLAVGDLLQAVDGTEISDVGALERRMKELARQRPKRVIFKVRRGIHTLYVELETQWPTPTSR